MDVRRKISSDAAKRLAQINSSKIIGGVGSESVSDCPPAIPPRQPIAPELPPRPIPERQPLLPSLAPPKRRGVPNDYVEDVGTWDQKGTNSNRTEDAGPQKPSNNDSLVAAAVAFRGRLPRVRDHSSRHKTKSESPLSPRGPPEPFVPESRGPSLPAMVQCSQDSNEEELHNRLNHEKEARNGPMCRHGVRPVSNSGPNTSTTPANPSESALLVLLPSRQSDKNKLARYGSQRSGTRANPSTSTLSSSSKKSTNHCAYSKGKGGDNKDGYRDNEDGYPVKSPPSSFVCSECGQCKCNSCVEDRPVPFDEGCLNCIDVVSCMCVPRKLFSRRRRTPACDCEEDSDDEDVCSCRPCGARCGGRWAVLAALSLCLPCICLYPLLRGCRKGAARCYNGCRRKCRCKGTPVAAPKWKEAPL